MYENLPSELKKLSQWGCYHRIWKEERGKYTKIPVNPWTGGPGKSNDSSTWSDFDTAMRALDQYPDADGLAFYFANGYVGLDIDHIAEDLEKVQRGDTDPDNLVTKAHEMTHGSYMEVSMSGEGIHCIFKGKIPGDRRRKGNYEMYQSGRFFALTGNTLNAKPEIKSLDDTAMRRLYDHYLHSDKVAEFPKKQPTIVENTLSIDEIIDRAERSTNGARFRAFMEGGWEPFYPSQSEADMAFANDLAFWCGRDFNVMDSIFRQSSLYRKKYDEKHGKTTYGIALLNKAINETSNVFNPHQPLNANYDMSFLNKERDKPKPPRTWDDMGNALRFIDMYGDNFKYSYIDKMWYLYNGSYWQIDQSGMVEKCADSVVKNMDNEKLNIWPGMDADDAMEKWAKFKAKCRSNRSKKSMLDEVKHHVPVLHSEFDTDLMLLNTESGYVDLNSGLLKDHDRSKMFSRQTVAEYTDTIDAPEWNEFLHQIFNNDEEVIHYIQKAVGYSATGSTKEQVMFLLYGNGRNGKSVFINTIADILGSYAETMNVESIMVKRSSGVNSDIARLEGARLVISSEANEGSRLDEGLVKQMTGGDKMVARHLYASEFEFTPRFKLWMATNHKPIIRGTDDGIWRRIMLIPFLVQIPKNKVDKDLKYKLQREASGILNWIVQGAMMWQREGLEPPESIRKASGEYRQEMDVIEFFISEKCERGEEYMAPAGELYDVYKKWSDESGEHQFGKQNFGREMKKKFAYKRTMHGIYYQGLRIVDDPRLNFINK